MDILIIDRDSLTNQLLSAKLTALGHEVIIEPNKNDALERIKGNNFDCVMIDPAPLSDALPIVVGVLRCLEGRQRPYMMILSKTATEIDAINAFSHDVLRKPFSSQDIEMKVSNAKRLMDIEYDLAKQDDIRSAGGLIGKAAFNQLFLSAMDRAFRYTEKSVIILLGMTNYDDIAAQAGQEEAEKIVVQLVEKMSFMRRQSDVIGRLGPHDFGIMLQRSSYENESIDALNRFADVLDKFVAEFAGASHAPRIELHMIELPKGALLKEKRVPLSREKQND